MKVTLVGTGGIHTSDNSASVLVDDKILIDVPNGSEKNLMKLDKEIENIDLILITHLHADHYFDLPFIFAYNEVKNREKILYVVGPKRTKEIIMEITHFAFNKHFDEYIEKYVRFIEFEEEKNIEILSKYDIRSVKVEHGKLDAYGYIINDKLGITGDTRMCEGVRKIAEESQVIISDVSMIEGTDLHMGINNIKELLIQNEHKKFIATHMRDITKKELKKNNIDRLIVPEDGYIFEI